MKKLISLLSLTLLFACTSSKKLFYSNVDAECDCIKKEGTWYQKKCWKSFDDEGFSKDEIDAVVDAELEVINATKIKWGEVEFPLHEFMPIEEDGQLILVTIFENKTGSKTLLSIAEGKSMKKKIFEVKTLLFNGNMIAGKNDSIPMGKGESVVTIIDMDQMIISFSGHVKIGEQKQSFFFKTNESIGGAGSSKITIKGEEAFISGDLGTITYFQMKELIKNHPEVKTLVLKNISGSVNDAVNMHTGRIIHEAGLNTKVLKDSDIASGGVDLFCAGKERIIQKGAKIGIHSWCCLDDLKANEIPKDHPAHKYQIEYFSMCMGAGNGPEFYFHTLDAANFDDIHWMTLEEMKKWKVGTKYID